MFHVHTFEKHILLAQQMKIKENEHIGLHHFSDDLQGTGEFCCLKLIKDEEKIIEEHFPNDNLKKAVNNYVKRRTKNEPEDY